MAKHNATRLSVDMACDAVQAFGGLGFARECGADGRLGPVEAIYRDPQDGLPRCVIASAYGIGGVVQEKVDVDYFFVDPTRGHQVAYRRQEQAVRWGARRSRVRDRSRCRSLSRGHRNRS